MSLSGESELKIDNLQAIGQEINCCACERYFSFTVKRGYDDDALVMMNHPPLIYSRRWFLVHTRYACLILRKNAQYITFSFFINWYAFHALRQAASVANAMNKIRWLSTFLTNLSRGRVLDDVLGLEDVLYDRWRRWEWWQPGWIFMMSPFIMYSRLQKLIFKK